jgi:hypothetical protein
VAGTRDLSEEHFSKDTEIMPILQNVIYVPYSRRPKKFEPRTTSVDSDATLSVRLAQCLRYFHVSFESPKCSSLTGVAGMWQACHWLPGTWPTATSRETLCQLTLKIDMMSIKFLIRTGRDSQIVVTVPSLHQYCVCFRFFCCFRCFR